MEGEEYESSSASDSEEGQEPSSYSVADLMEQAFKAIDNCQPELAAAFFDRALTLDPDNADLLDEYSELLLANDNVTKASRLLQQSIAVAPEAGHAKYMNMAQLLEGRESVQCFEKGLELLERALGDCADEEVRRGLVREISAGHVSVGELWMTDLCFEPEAEAECEKHVMRAVERDARYAEAWHTLASLRISQQRPEEALAALQKGAALWLPAEGDDDNDEVKRMDEGDDEGAGGEEEASYGSRLSVAKMFLELGDTESTLDVCSMLMLENEDDPELYFLTALASQDQEERKSNVTTALEKIAKLEQAGETDLEHLKKAVSAFAATL